MMLIKFKFRIDEKIKNKFFILRENFILTSGLDLRVFTEVFDSYSIQFTFKLLNIL